MASFDLKIEDSSPLISYAPDAAWTDIPLNDSLCALYSGRSLHTTATQGATATINFNGTGMSIFGGRRSNYGTFTIAVDGQTITSGDASSLEDTVQQLLGSASSLIDGPHTAVLTNTGGAAIDIDWIGVRSQVGPTNSELSIEAYDDNDPRINYLPSNSDWSTNNDQSFMNNTLHFTQTPGASASISFSGDAVAVYGTMSPDHANVLVTVDGRPNNHTGGSGGFVSGLRTQVLLYYENNLGPAQHTLTMSRIFLQNTGPFIDIDSVTVFSSVPISNNNRSESSTSSNPMPASSAPGHSVPSGSTRPSGFVSKFTIIGAVFGAVLGFLLLLTLVCLFIRRKRSGPSRINKLTIRFPSTPDLPMQGAVMMETGFARVMPDARFDDPLPPPPAVTIARHSIAPSYYSDPIYGSDSMVGRTSSISMLVPGPRPGDMPGDSVMSPARPSCRPPPLDLEM